MRRSSSGQRINRKKESLRHENPGDPQGIFGVETNQEAGRINSKLDWIVISSNEREERQQPG